MVTSEGKVLESDLMDKASDLWERATDKAEEKHDDRASSTRVSFADVVPQDFQKRLLSSSAFSRDLIEPITDYFMKLEMTETSCPSLSDLNLVGEIDRISPLLIRWIFSVEYVAYEDLKGEHENDLKNGGYRPFVNYLRSFIPNDHRVRLNSEVVRVKFDEQRSKTLGGNR